MALHGKPISELRGVTCHMGSHSFIPATWHKWTRPALIPAKQASSRFTYPGRMEGWVDLDSSIADRPGIEPTTAWSQVRRPNRYATKSPSKYYHMQSLGGVSKAMEQISLIKVSRWLKVFTVVILNCSPLLHIKLPRFSPIIAVGFSVSLQFLVVTCFCHNNCCLPYVWSLTTSFSQQDNALG